MVTVEHRIAKATSPSETIQGILTASTGYTIQELNRTDQGTTTCTQYVEAKCVLDKEQ